MSLHLACGLRNHPSAESLLLPDVVSLLGATRSELSIVAISTALHRSESVCRGACSHGVWLGILQQTSPPGVAPVLYGLV